MKLSILLQSLSTELVLNLFSNLLLNMLNQISIWFNQELCLGVYTNRILWLSSLKNACLLFIDSKMPRFLVTPRWLLIPHSSAIHFTISGDLWVFNWSMMNIHCPFGSVDTLFLMNVRKSSDVRVDNKIPLTFPLPISNDAMSVVVPCRIYSCSCFSLWFGIKGLSGSALSIDCIPDFSSTDSKWIPSDFSLMASL